MTRNYTLHLASEPFKGLTEEILLSFSDALDRERGVTAAVPAANLVTGTLRVTCSVRADDPEEALSKARRAFERALRLGGAPKTSLAEIEIEADEDNGDRHDLLTGAEVARRVGISRERIRQLAARPQRFPPATATAGSYRLWRWGDVLDWARVQGRQIGTKRRTARGREKRAG